MKLKVLSKHLQAETKKNQFVDKKFIEILLRMAIKNI